MSHRPGDSAPSIAPAAPVGWFSAPLLRASAVVHAAALGAVVARPALWPWAAVAVAADHLALVGASLAPRSGLLGPNLRRLPARPDTADAVALTFDDGPDPRVTPVVLDLLAGAGARASFFCIGRRARQHPDLVAEIVRRGHRVENHSDLHRHDFAFLPPRALARDLERAQASLAAAAGRAPMWFRAPAGFRNPWLGPVLARRGLRLASWTRRGFDTVSRDPRAVVARLTRGLAARDILLLHDRADAAGWAVTPEALPRLLDRLGERGLRAIAIPP